jgi:hypothetical protein
VPLLLVEFGAQTTQVLGILGGLVTLTGNALSESFLMIKTSAVLLAEFFLSLCVSSV